MSDWVCCPYNPRHQMYASRLKWHLTKSCRDMQQLGHLYSVCPYNPAHHVPSSRLHSHISQCESRWNKAKCGAIVGLNPDLAEETWDPTWPKERKNLNVQYIPAAARNRPVTASREQDLRDFNVKTRETEGRKEVNCNEGPESRQDWGKDREYAKNIGRTRLGPGFSRL